MLKNKKKLLLIIIISIIVIILTISTLLIINKIKEQKKKEEQLALVQAYYDNKIKQYEEENQTLTNVDIVFIGDSLTDGYDLNKYYPNYQVINRGIGGDTTFGVEKRLKVSLYDINPKVVVLLIGGNNLSTMFENYESILQQIKENLPNTKVVLLSLTAMGQGLKDKNDIAVNNNKEIKALAIKYDFTYVDLFTPLYNKETEEIYAEYTTDGAHFTTDGYEVVTSVIRPVLKELLEK